MEIYIYVKCLHNYLEPKVTRQVQQILMNQWSSESNSESLWIFMLQEKAGPGRLIIQDHKKIKKSQTVGIKSLRSLSLQPPDKHYSFWPVLFIPVVHSCTFKGQTKQIYSRVTD